MLRGNPIKSSKAAGELYRLFDCQISYDSHSIFQVFNVTYYSSIKYLYFIIERHKCMQNFLVYVTNVFDRRASTSQSLLDSMFSRTSTGAA